MVETTNEGRVENFYLQKPIVVVQWLEVCTTWIQTCTGLFLYQTTGD